MTSTEDLIDRIYEAAATPQIWPGLLTDIARCAGCEGGFLGTWNTSYRWEGYRISENLTLRFEECMRAGHARRSITTARLLAADHSGFVSDDQIFTEEEYASDPWTTDWAAYNNIYHGAATAIRIPTGDLVVVQIMRRAGLPALNRADLDRLDALRPHLARSGFLAARWRLERMRAAAEALAIIGLPAAILDLDGRTLAANALIQALPAHVVWLPDDRLTLTDHSAAFLLRRAIRDLDKPAAPSVRSFPARNRRTGETVVVHLIPALRSSREVFDGGFGVLVLTPLTSPAPPDSALIEALFDLTPAEARVACGIVAGQTVTEMAALYNVASETIRTHVKAILAKTGVRRQTEAAGKLAALPRIVLPPERR